MKTQSFKAYIYKIKYSKVENENPHFDPVSYRANVSLLECKKGKARRTYHNAVIYLTEQQFNEQSLGVMDKIEIKDTADWKSKYFSLNIYDQEKLKQMSDSQLLQDVNGRTYARANFYAYTLHAKIGDWTLLEKGDECCYIQCGKVKFYIAEHQVDEPAYCFFFDVDTFDKIVDINMQTVPMNCYLHKQKKWQKQIEVQSAYDPDSEKYFANLIVKEE